MAGFPPTAREVEVIQMAVSCVLGEGSGSLVEMVGRLELEAKELPWWRVRERRELRFQSSVISRIAVALIEEQPASTSTRG